MRDRDEDYDHRYDKTCNCISAEDVIHELVSLRYRWRAKYRRDVALHGVSIESDVTRTRIPKQAIEREHCSASPFGKSRKTALWRKQVRVFQLRQLVTITTFGGCNEFVNN